MIQGGKPVELSIDQEVVYTIRPFTQREAAKWGAIQSHADRLRVKSVRNQSADDAIAEAMLNVDQQIEVLADRTDQIEVDGDTLTAKDAIREHYESLVATDVAILSDSLVKSRTVRDLLFRRNAVPGAAATA